MLDTATFSNIGIVEPSMPSAATVALYLDKMFAKGGGEFIGEYAVPLPVAVIAALLGLPPDMTHKCKEWPDALMDPLSGMLSEEREIECAHQFVERQRYFAAAVERIRREGGPPEHLITRVASARRTATIASSPWPTKWTWSGSTHDHILHSATA